MPRGPMFNERFKCPKCGHEEWIKRYTSSRGKTVGTCCRGCRKEVFVVSGGKREPVPHNPPKAQPGPKDPKPIPLPAGVRILAFGVNGESWPVQVYPWPDVTLAVGWDGNELIHDGDKYRGKIMLAGIWGETSTRVLIRVICTSDEGNGRAWTLLKLIRRDGWEVEGAGRDTEAVKA